MTALATTKILTENKRTIMDGNATLHASKRLAVFVFLLTIGFSLAYSHTSLAAGVWTNEPAGASVIMDCPFNSVSGCGILDVYSSSIQDSDGSASVSPSGVVRATIYAGNLSGGMQLSYGTPQISREIYMGLIWRTNPQFYGRPQHDKMFFIKGPQTNGFFGMRTCPGCTQRQIGWGFNASNADNSHACADTGLWCYPNVGSPAVTIGQWAKIEVYMKSSTTLTSRDGIVRWWINGQLAGNYTNLNHAPSGLNEWTWSETWDGYLNPAPSVDWSHYLDHLHISIPGGSNATDQPPGPPASPTMRGVTTP